MLGGFLGFQNNTETDKFWQLSGELVICNRLTIRNATFILRGILYVDNSI